MRPSLRGDARRVGRKMMHRRLVSRRMSKRIGELGCMTRTRKQHLVLVRSRSGCGRRRILKVSLAANPDSKLWSANQRKYNLRILDLFLRMAAREAVNRHRNVLVLPGYRVRFFFLCLIPQYISWNLPFSYPFYRFYGINLNQNVVLQQIGFDGSSGSPWTRLFKIAIGNVIITVLGFVPGSWISLLSSCYYLLLTCP